MLSCGVKVTRRGKILEGEGGVERIKTFKSREKATQSYETGGTGCSVLPDRFALSHRIPVSLFTWQERKPGLAVAL